MDKSVKILITTHVVELSLVPEQRVVLPVFAVAVLVVDEAPPLLAAAGGRQRLAGRDVGRPEAVDPLVAQQHEQLHHGWHLESFNRGKQTALTIFVHYCLCEYRHIGPNGE